MRNKWVWVSLAVLALIAGCGKDGAPGLAFLGVWMEWQDADEIYYMSCAALPAGSFTYGLTWYGSPYSNAPPYYQVDPGSYSYTYKLRWWYSSGGYWVYSSYIYGTLTIEAEQGEKGSFPFKDGADGEDRNYNWVLGWSGSDLSFNAQSEAPAPPAPKAVVQTQNEAPGPQPPDSSLYEIGERRVIRKSDGVYRITIDEYPYYPKGETPAAPKSARVQ